MSHTVGLTLALAAALLAATPVDKVVERLPSGVALPYPSRHVFRGFGRCLGNGRHYHEALDLGGIGPDGGLGTPVRSMVRARVVKVGSAARRPEDFGTPYRGKRPVVRSGRKYPGSKEIPGYGKVHFFTARRGKWRSGNMIETVGLEPPLEGHRIRYMHLGAVRPDLESGDILEAGDEVGLLGGTGVQTSSPHVHIDIRTAENRPVDVAPLLGLPPTASCGPVKDEAIIAADDFGEATPTGPMPPDRWPAGPTTDARPALELDPPPPPWRVAVSAPPGGGATPQGTEALEVAAAHIDIPDCGVFERLGTGPADLRAHLFERRWLELSLAPSTGAATPALELWDTHTNRRLLPGAAAPIALTELAAGAGQPARLRLVVTATSEVAFVIRSHEPWQLRIAERCRRPAAP